MGEEGAREKGNREKTTMLGVQERPDILHRDTPPNGLIDQKNSSKCEVRAGGEREEEASTAHRQSIVARGHMMNRKKKEIHASTVSHSIRRRVVRVTVQSRSVRSSNRKGMARYSMTGQGGKTNGGQGRGGEDSCKNKATMDETFLTRMRTRRKAGSPLLPPPKKRGDQTHKSTRKCTSGMCHWCCGTGTGRWFARGIQSESGARVRKKLKEVTKETSNSRGEEAGGREPEAPSTRGSRSSGRPRTGDENARKMSCR